MYIKGIGVIFAGGKGIASLEKALRAGWASPRKVSRLSRVKKPFFSYHVPDVYLRDNHISSIIRRADRFGVMAAIAAKDALRDASCPMDGTGKDRMGIIATSAFGPHATTFKVLDDMIDYGGKNVSPTLFANSLHNAAVHYISLLAGGHGPTMTISQHDMPFHAGLLLAKAWISEGRCDKVLLGAVDILSGAMQYIWSKKLFTARDGKIRPFAFSKRPLSVPGEGSVFFLLTKRASRGGYCGISDISVGDNGSLPGACDINIIEADGMISDETVYSKVLSIKARTEGYAPIYGSLLTGSAFSSAIAALMIKKRVVYPSPIKSTKNMINVLSVKNKVAIDAIQTIRYDCSGKRAHITFKK